VPPFRTIHASAPIRVCDNGGWTDTWVARYGKVFNIAVRPVVEVRIDVFPSATRQAQVRLDPADVGERYDVDLHATAWGPHPLLEAAIRRMPPPNDVDIEITIHSEAPAGASTGTSAAVSVALLGALDRLSGRARAAYEIAREAHAIETEDLRQQSGVQDQIASAFGGINFIEIDDYPHALVTPLVPARGTLAELDDRLSLIYFGKPHRSSDVHERVVRDLEQHGPDCGPLQALRAAAVHARDAILAGELAALGRAMRENTAAQAELHADLVSRDAWRIIEIANKHQAAGWKVNGAGGDGGSITLLGASDAESRAEMIRAILHEHPAWRLISIGIDLDGLRVSEEPSNPSAHSGGASISSPKGHSRAQTSGRSSGWIPDPK
jgi:D-glycero-alpha-D-manno-heptose-7-phosphate kinase